MVLRLLLPIDYNNLIVNRTYYYFKGNLFKIVQAKNLQEISYINYPKTLMYSAPRSSGTYRILSIGLLIQGKKRFYSGSTLNKESPAERGIPSESKNFNITPVKYYPNADTQKSLILKDNKNKSGVYR